MRTLELHASLKQVQRSDGRSAVAAAAYRSGSRIRDERTGELHNYSRKTGVEHTEIYTPANAPDWANDRAKLWNAAEEKENRSNSMTARELEIGFPAEFNEQQRREAGEKIAKYLCESLSCAVDIAYHQPDTEGDQRNYHAHILFTGRSFDESTADGWAKNKYRDLNKDQITVDGEKTIRSSHTTKLLRTLCADTFNQIAGREAFSVKIEHESFKKRRIERVPTVKLGPNVVQMEKRGIETDRGNLNREIEAINCEKQKIKKLEAEIINLEAERKKREIITPEQVEKVFHSFVEKAFETIDNHQKKLKQEVEAARKALKNFRAEPHPEVPTHWLYVTKKRAEDYEKQVSEWHEKKNSLSQSVVQAESALRHHVTNNIGSDNAKAIAMENLRKFKPDIAAAKQKFEAEAAQARQERKKMAEEFQKKKKAEAERLAQERRKQYRRKPDRDLGW